MTINTALLEQRMRDSTRAPEPGDTPPGTVVAPAKGEIDTLTMGEMTSAGWVYVWDTVTGERSIANRNMLPVQLQKKRSDDSYVFTTVDPGITPKRGKLKCLLHPDSFDRAHYDELGLPTCPKANLTSPMQVELHMRHRHKIEWATIERERLESEKKEERTFQRNLLRGMETKSRKAK